MNYLLSRRKSNLVPIGTSVFSMTFFSVLSLASGVMFSQTPSNVYRPPADNFVPNNRVIRQGQAGPQVIQNFQQGRIYQSVPQYQTVPSTPLYTYPQQSTYPLQTQTPIYQQPMQQAPVQVVPHPSQVSPARSVTENNELKRSLVKARELMRKFQGKLEELKIQNQELQNEIENLKTSGDMGNSDTSNELADAKAAAAKARQQISGVNTQLQSTLQQLQTSKGELDRQKQNAAQLQQQVVSLQKAAQMAAGSDEQVAELTKNLEMSKAENDQLNGKVTALQNALRDKETAGMGASQQVAQLTKNIDQFKTQNNQLSVKVTTLENALREKETQISSMGSDENTQLDDLKELLEESETTNEDLSAKLKIAQAESAEMTAPQEGPALDQLRADNQRLGKQKEQLESRISQLEEQNSKFEMREGKLETREEQLNDMIEKLTAENLELDATVTRLSNMPAPAAEPSGFAATLPAATSSPDVTGLRNQLASATRQNAQLKCQLKFSKSKYASLTDENARLLDESDTKATTEVAVSPASVTSVVPDDAPAAVVVPELGLSSVSAGWPVKYWIFGMLGVGLAVGLGVAWYESIVDPKSLRRATGSASNQ